MKRLAGSRLVSSGKLNQLDVVHVIAKNPLAANLLFWTFTPITIAKIHFNLTRTANTSDSNKVGATVTMMLSANRGPTVLYKITVVTRDQRFHVTYRALGEFTSAN